MPTPSRADGEVDGLHGAQSAPSFHDQVSPRPLSLNPPNNTTARAPGSNALPAPTNLGTWVVGVTQVQSIPSQVQVLSVRMVSPLPPVSTTLWRSTSRVAVPQPLGIGRVWGWSCFHEVPVQ